MKVGYARVSTKEQNEARQIKYDNFKAHFQGGYEER